VLAQGLRDTCTPFGREPAGAGQPALHTCPVRRCRGVQVSTLSRWPAPQPDRRVSSAFSPSKILVNTSVMISQDRQASEILGPLPDGFGLLATCFILHMCF
jgi:hypothetical protein